MKESDYPEDEYVWMPIRKKSMAKFIILFPDATPEDFVNSIDPMFDAALDLIYAGNKKKAFEEQQISPTKQQPVSLESLYVPERLSECAKELYR
jgi:hypothetical protein